MVAGGNKIMFEKFRMRRCLKKLVCDEEIIEDFEIHRVSYLKVNVKIKEYPKGIRYKKEDKFYHLMHKVYDICKRNMIDITPIPNEGRWVVEILKKMTYKQYEDMKKNE